MTGLFKESLTDMNYTKTIIWGFLVFMLPMVASAQCGTFNESPRGSDGLDAYSVYRQAIKMEDWPLAFDQWQVAYDIAPAYDGTRDVIFMDGAMLYVRKHGEATDPEMKKQYTQKVLALYDQCVSCYEQNKIKVENCTDQACIDAQIGIVLGRKAFDMFYSLSSPYGDVLSILQRSLELAGNKSEYIILAPFATVLTYQFSHDKVDIPTARKNILDLLAMADYNIEHNKAYAQYYQQGKEYAQSQFAKIEGVIFDWQYFKEKFQPMYEADPDNFDNIKMMIAKLKGQDCPADDEFLVMLEDKWAVYAEKENARIQAELEAKYPNLAAKRLFDEGKYDEAIDKYMEAIDQAESDEDKGGYWFAIASIQFRKQGKYVTARESALKAAKLKKGWGRPYMLIGDMYGATARNCGDAWQQSLAILAAIEKYRYARSIDSEVADEAQGRINTYMGSRPSQDLGFMQGVKDGDKVKVECWIGEIVTMDYKK